MIAYQHTQFGSAFFWPLFVCSVIAAATAFISATAGIGIIVAVLLALTLWLFAKLTITIDDKNLRAAFGPGFFYKQVPLTQIESCLPVRIKWWEGWGIHLSRFGWLYNVSGWDAVAIRLRDRRQFAVGTDQPEQLAAAIRKQITE
jgi:hypothetical protein